ncbi:hypothetical protein BWZ43_02110 [Heyndrickxia oleronia]|uniref:Uncharacterized protein n=2 Tax=Heyndrickxia oleronia TaxID=38875 RepID=A0A8E2IAZ0_9BACI|nr:hypothetical protein BWZ43_02110 [Heyndrickxia oleronia]
MSHKGIAMIMPNCHLSSLLEMKGFSTQKRAFISHVKTVHIVSIILSGKLHYLSKIYTGQFL